MHEPLESPATAADGETHALDPRWVAYQRRIVWVNVPLVAGVLAGAGAAVVLLSDVPLIPVAAVAVVLLVANTAISVWWPGVAYRYASYRLNERALEIRRGVLWRSVIDVPRSRIQHSDVSQGPIERAYGLGTLSVYTAGTAHALVRLNGLDHGRALAIREHLLQSDDDVV